MAGQTPAVQAVFDAFPQQKRRKLLALRALILGTAKRTAGVGALEETLKWGEPAYLTTETKSGTTVRISCGPRDPRHYGVYVHCQTNLIETFRTHYPDAFEYDANRGIRLNIDDALPETELASFIAAALTYHLSKRSKLRVRR